MANGTMEGALDSVSSQVSEAFGRLTSLQEELRVRLQTVAERELSAMGVDPAGFRSKSWDEFAAPGAPRLDIVITVCDNAAGEVCPVWPGQPVTAHWGFPDPAAVEGDDATKQHAFSQIAHQLRTRIQLLLSLPMDKLDRLALQERVRSMGARAEADATG